MSNRLEFAGPVTAAHARLFAEELVESIAATMAFDEAFAETGLVTWPDEKDAQFRYHDIVDEIQEITMAALKDAITEAFLKAARDVLAKERRSQERVKE